MKTTTLNRGQAYQRVALGIHLVKGLAASGLVTEEQLGDILNDAMEVTEMEFKRSHLDSDFEAMESVVNEFFPDEESVEKEVCPVCVSMAEMGSMAICPVCGHNHDDEDDDIVLEGAENNGVPKSDMEEIDAAFKSMGRQQPQILTVTAEEYALLNSGQVTMEDLIAKKTAGTTHKHTPGCGCRGDHGVPTKEDVQEAIRELKELGLTPEALAVLGIR